MQFDARAARQMSTGQYFTISDCPGLRLKASATGRSWIYRYKSPVDERMRQVKIGEWPAMSVAAAIVAWEKLREERMSGADAAGAKKAERDAGRRESERLAAAERLTLLTVERVCNDYLVERVEKSRNAKGAKEVRRMFATMLGSVAEMEAATLTRAHAFDLINSFVHIPVQASKLRAEMGAAWDFALDAGRLPPSSPNWWRLIMRGKLRSKGRYIQGARELSKRVLDQTEIGILLRWLPNFSRLVADACTLYLWTCTRGAEILQMERQEITDEADGMWWTVPKSKTKNSWREEAVDLRVPLIGRAEAIVRRRLESEKGSYLFPARGKLPYTAQKVIGHAVWFHMPYSESKPESARPRLSVTKWAPHDLRRTGRTQLAALGCSADVAEAVIGHMPTGIRGVYDRHSYDKERREWLTRLSEHLERLAHAGSK